MMSRVSSREGSGHSLAIVSGPVDAARLRAAKPSSTDLLALDLPAMQACRSSGSPFLTPSDFYSSSEFRSTCEVILRGVERLFELERRRQAAVGDFWASIGGALCCGTMDGCRLRRGVPTSSGRRRN